MSENNLLDEYKLLYDNSKRDSDKFMQMMLILQDVIVNLKDVAKNLQDDNQSLRTQLYNNRQINDDYMDRTEFPDQISTFIDIIHEEDNHQNQNIPTYSIPPHVRQIYLQHLQHLGDNQCSICLSPIQIDTIELTECGHIFHIACIRRHRENNNNCPVCRTNF